MATQDSAKPRANADYTIGWVCALPKEQTAATAMLDERHGGPVEKPPNDQNTYTLGSFGKHNVVIVCLPQGRIGNNAAATVATQMIDTFPSIKFGLMVGIGGGIPTKVRLGDVVVSAPAETYPGVIQWDLGKAEETGTEGDLHSFKRTGSLNSPPNVLLTALTKLRTEHEMNGPQIPQYLQDLKRNWPRLAEKYTKSSSLEDVLFRAESSHINANVIPSANSIESDVEEEETEETNDCRFCDKTKVVRRKPRDMKVHYGLIASGNQVVKNAVFRDALNKRLGGNVLCIEMEAAGLMNNFPCMVIRGICDYADSHKNKDWQEYAAAVAAAFAKELLSMVPAQAVEQMVQVNKILSGISLHVEEVVSRLRSQQRDQEQQAILDWLTLVDYAPQQNDYFHMRQPGTGQWLLDSPEFQTLLNGKSQTLFCPGMPGAGKTILTSIVVDKLTSRFQDNEKTCVAYIYCNFRRQDEQRISDLLASLLRQFVEPLSSVPRPVEDLYNRHKTQRTRPCLKELSSALHQVVGEYSQAFIIVDALDECPATDGYRQRLLTEVFSLQTQAEVNIFATSRPISEVVDEFRAYMSVEILATDDDVRTYLSGHVSHLPLWVRTNLSLRDEIINKISGATDGMFLLAKLYIGALRGKSSPKAIRDSLQNLATRTNAYATAYEEAMERIGHQLPDETDLANRALSWIAFAKRPLTTRELQHALGVEIGKSKLDRENLPPIEQIVTVCAGLVIVDQESEIVRLVHYTTQEYFDLTWGKWFPSIQDDITTICATYLLFDEFQSGGCRDDREFENRLQSNCLYSYVSHHWGDHARETTGVNPVLISFLETNGQVEASSQVLLVENMTSIYPGCSQYYPEQMTGLHLVTNLGLKAITKTLLERGADLGTVTTYGKTPLHEATVRGHLEVARLLLERGADLGAVTISGETPLYGAVARGHLEVVRLLLERGADLGTVTLRGETPLYEAVASGHHEVVRLLLERGADLGTVMTYGKTPLYEAVASGHLEVVRLLLERGADLGAVTISGETPLYRAVARGHLEVARLLLERGADLGTVTLRGETPLYIAAAHGYLNIIQLLLERGADPGAVTLRGETPLYIAEARGYLNVIRLLKKAIKIGRKEK